MSVGNCEGGRNEQCRERDGGKGGSRAAGVVVNCTCNCAARHGGRGELTS